MLGRFSLYGFLKNQLYFEPFLYLALREMGLSWFQIGLLIGFRAVIINLMEIPSGAVADVWGRRKSMMLSFGAYIASFLVLGLTGLAGSLSPFARFLLLFPGMLLYGIGDAFRTGTHKAMIFTWLRIHDRTNERTRIYGYTRSWSKIGSAISVLIAAGLVFASHSYIYIFFFSIIPYLLGLINFMGYPKELDVDKKQGLSLRAVWIHLKEALSISMRRASLRGLIMESMGFEGVFRAAKDYLQPILKSAAVPLFSAMVLTEGLGEKQAAAVLAGPVFFVLYLLSAFASRKAHVFVDMAGTEERGARHLWAMNLIIFLLLLPAMYLADRSELMIFTQPVLIAGFMCLYIMQNLWRPALISRFDSHSSESQGATILSIESQAKSLATAIIAPSLGFAVDAVKVSGHGGEFWPVGLVGAMISLLFLARSYRAGQ